MRRPIAAMLLVLMSPGLAADDAPSVSLQVKPVLCIIDARTPRCDLSFLVFWQSSDSGYYCLFNDFMERPIRCWQEARRGQVDDRRTVDGAFSYWVTRDRSAEPLARATVEVLRMDGDDRRRRRRTRHVWDLL